jgi:hypothetical protein
MSASQPPRLASWLLQHLASSPRRDSLAGDLIERYHDGHSAAWYWRQVLWAILAGVARDVRDHKLLAIRAVAIGWLLAVLFSFPVDWISNAGRAWMIELAEPRRYSFWWVFWSGQLPYALLVYAACVISGWIIARLHQAHAVAMVAVYAAAVLVADYGMASWMWWWRDGLPPMPQLALIVLLLLMIGHPISIAIGGLWALGADSNTTLPASSD